MSLHNNTLLHKGVLLGKKASVFKYIQLLSARNFKELCNLGCFSNMLKLLKGV